MKKPALTAGIYMTTRELQLHVTDIMRAEQLRA
jgi:hypothetical protein